MDYPEALQYILSFTNLEFQRHVPYSERALDLVRIQTLLDALDNPHEAFQAIHIAGSKGKGSTAAMVEAVLRQARLHPGLYTSPHLHTFRERVRVDGDLISPEGLTAIVRTIRAVVPGLPYRPNTFDILTAIGFRHFADQGVYLAVVEVGLGGRLDSTNVVYPVITVITSLGLEHTAILGPTLSHIAREKAGILKPGVPLITVAHQPEAMLEIERLADRLEVPVEVVGRDWHYRLEEASPVGLRVSVWCEGEADYRDLEVSLRGTHQALNTAVAIATLHRLRRLGWDITETHVREGLRHVWWPGRMEVLQREPTLLLDSAHTVEASRRLLESITKWFPHQHLHLIFGVSRDKQIGALLELFWPHVDSLIITRSEHPRAANPEAILQHVPEAPGPEVYMCPQVEAALATALELAGPDDLICACGSIFVAAAVREIWAQSYGSLAPTDWAYVSDFPLMRRLMSAPSQLALRRRA